MKIPFYAEKETVIMKIRDLLGETGGYRNDLINQRSKAENLDAG